MIAVWIFIFLYVVFALGAHRSDVRIEVEGVLLLTILVAAALCYVGMTGLILGGVFGANHRREVGTYLSVGLLALILAAVLTFTREQSMAMISATVAPFALLFGFAELRLARGFSQHHRQARALFLCGFLEMSCGILLVLAAVHLFDEISALRLIALTAMISLLQLVPFLSFRPHGFQNS
jgi:hypothetical protein